MLPVYHIEYFVAPNGKKPFTEWLDTLDLKIYAIIQSRIDRLEIGNLGDCRSLGSDLHELRIHYGAGYRVYFTVKNRRVVILLAGGEKKSQEADIKKVKQWLSQ